ncbi:YjjG family noncanonical pyrimidine nucleotidase [Allomuricauda sp. d1]|uniref:YjjG family noncanonical pyrimidine nucleotidase n=1 Tax=Allomuricauda sp. d1 TaxID=3136725 RepID=UPI0031D2A330
MFRNGITDIFFDLDHTLWDFEKNSALTFEKILLQHQIEVHLPHFLEIYVPLNQEYWKLYREERVTKAELRYQRLKKTFDALQIRIEDTLIDVLANDYIAHLSSFRHIFPNTREALDYLLPKYRLHIITNGFTEIQYKKLKNADIHHYFDQIIDSETAGVKKPHPKIFEVALDRAGVSPEKTLMVGDNLEADILGAQAMGMNALHFNAHREPDHDVCPIITDLIEIKNIL